MHILYFHAHRAGAVIGALVFEWYNNIRYKLNGITIDKNYH